MVIVLAIGKTILILLLVIVCILAAVLLLPVRYELKADLDEKQADIRVSWLLKLLRFRFHAQKEKMKAVLSILFFTIDFTDPEAKKRRAEKKAAKAAKKAAKAAKKAAKERRKREKASAKEKRKREKVSGQRRREFEKQRSKAEKAAERDAVSSNKISGAADKISDAAEKVSDAVNKLPNAAGKVSGAGKTAKRVIGLLKKYDVLDIVWPRLVRFLKRIRPRKLNGRVEFGMEDPASTGKIVGALAMMPLFYRTELRIVPDFETDETYIKGHVEMKGYLMLLHVVIFAVSLIRQKKLRGFVGALRHGGE